MNYSATKVAESVRELPVALAQTFVRTKPDSPRLETLNRLFVSMSLADQLRCRAELFECREARRGTRDATILNRRKQCTPHS